MKLVQKCCAMGDTLGAFDPVPVMVDNVIPGGRAYSYVRSDASASFDGRPEICLCLSSLVK